MTICPTLFPFYPKFESEDMEFGHNPKWECMAYQLYVERWYGEHGAVQIPDFDNGCWWDRGAKLLNNTPTL